MDQPVRIAYAGSATLARQVSAGAPADIVISANADWMDWLVQQSAVEPTSVTRLLSNQLVLVGHGWSGDRLALTPDALAQQLGREPLAMALVDAVPAGIYGKAALTFLGIWDDLAPQVVQSDNVRSALALVARGEAPFGIVYATDAALSEEVGVVGVFDSGTHPKIIYPAALTRTAHGDAASLFEALQSPRALATFAAHGFIPLTH